MYRSSPAPALLTGDFSALATWSHEGEAWEGMLAADPGFEIVWRSRDGVIDGTPQLTPASQRPIFLCARGCPVTLRMLRFRPEGVGAWIGGAVSELVDCRSVDLSALGLGWQGVSGAKTEAELLGALVRLAPKERDPMAQASVVRLRAARPPLYRALAHEMGYSYEQWRRRMERATGVSPKFLARYYRLQKASRLARVQPAMSMAEVAFRTGFASDCALAAESSALAGRTFRNLVSGFTLPE